MTRRRPATAVFAREAIVVYAPRRRPRSAPVTSSLDVAEFFRGLIADRVVEHFIVLGLDTKNRPVAWMTVGIGAVAACPVAPIDVFRFACLAGCSAIVLGHNHPSGDVQPSADDLALTVRIIEGGKLLGVRVLDHVIVGENGSFSFLDAGLLG